MAEEITLSAKNCLDIPIRLTLTNAGYRQDNALILITIGKEGSSLKDYYRVCIDADLLPSQEWRGIGTLEIASKHEVSIRGLIPPNKSEEVLT